MIQSVSKAVQYMAKRRIGALIVFEKETGLQDYIVKQVLQWIQTFAITFNYVFMEYTFNMMVNYYSRH